MPGRSYFSCSAMCARRFWARASVRFEKANRYRLLSRKQEIGRALFPVIATGCQTKAPWSAACHVSSRMPDVAYIVLPPPAMDFNQRPFTVVWETTRACDLACVHCRAGANSQRSAGELTFDEAQTLIQGIKAFGAPYPLFILTGGIQPNARIFSTSSRLPASKGCG